MDYLKEARAVILAAEKGLRALMERAVDMGAYESVAMLAKLARALGKATAEEAERRTIARDVRANAEPCPKSQTTFVTAPKGKAPRYPRFEIADGRLVKVGWSKRGRSEYRHKASKEAALAVFLTLGSAGRGQVFRMEELVPVLLSDGTEIPSYQSYSVLAWLRNVQQIEKRANDSYEWVGDDANASTFELIWQSTAKQAISRKSQRR